MTPTVAAMMQQAARHHADGALAAAADLYRRIVEIAPTEADAMHSLAIALAQLGRAREAERAARQALALRPRSATYFATLGSTLALQRRPAEAIAAFRQAVKLEPTHLAAWTNLGGTLREMNAFAAAEEACRAALRLDPSNARAMENLGAVLRWTGRTDAAVACMREALQILPNDPSLHLNLAGALLDRGDLAEAERHARAAVRLAPTYAAARYQLACLCLLAGQYDEGWALFEARHDLPSRPVRRFNVPLWTGEPTEDPVLVHAEDGIGDTIQFSRFVTEAAGRAPIVLEVPRSLRRLFGTLAGPTALLARGDPMPPVAAYAPIASLPLRLGVDQRGLAPTIPYLTADPALRAGWRARLAERPGRAIGLVWAGNPLYDKDARRSIPLAMLAPLLAVPDIRFISLQKSGAQGLRAGLPEVFGTAGAATAIPDGMPIEDWTAALTDFADTAALIAELDLVISVDTAVAHLAGALARPVWLLNRFDTDWRWGPDGSGCAWYPTLRQFRQRMPGAWDTVVAEVAAALGPGGFAPDART